MIDTSASMVEELRDAELAAERFLREILTERDRAAVITFADTPRLAARFTGNLESSPAGSPISKRRRDPPLRRARLRPPLLLRHPRQAALVILSDFADSGSRYRMDGIVEYATAPVSPSTASGLNVPRDTPEAELMLERLARETGGRAFRISRVAELNTIYETIRAELRSQCLIAYSRPTDSGSRYRTIEVKVGRSGVEARTLKGYYP
ncbi:MAG: hypothetical protein R2862_09075 [Thermoanaerobaculia bacterium]